MSFSDILGQDRVISILRRARESERISHSYLFTGEDGCGKKKTALEFAKWLNCSETAQDFACDSCKNCKKIIQDSHPEIRVCEPIKSVITIDQIREIQRFMQYKQTESRHKIVIIESAESMTREASNSFLKTLEEPPPGVIIILITNSLATMLKTIISRCQVLRFRTLSQDEKIEILIKDNEYDKKSIQDALAAASGNITKAKLLLDTPDDNEISDFIRLEELAETNKISSQNFKELEALARDKEKFKNYIDFLITKHEHLSRKEGYEKDLKLDFLLKIKKYINRNVNPRLIWAWMSLNN